VDFEVKTLCLFSKMCGFYFFFFSFLFSKIRLLFILHRIPNNIQSKDRERPNLIADMHHTP